MTFQEDFMLRTLTILAVILASISVAHAQTPATRQPSAFEQEMIDQQKHFLLATLHKDAAVVDASVAEDFKGIGPNGDFYERNELVEAAHEVTHDDQPKTARAYDFQVVRLDEQSAVVSYNLIVPGEHPRYRHMADTWTKINNQWKLKFRQVTPNLWSANDLD
jgi:hypothetical protein